MKGLDIILNALLPSLILLHLLLAPYTKVEESFNIQAIHDISVYGLSSSNISSYLQAHYDHSTFPGAVPRTFFGALALAPGVSALTRIVGAQHGQTIARALLGLWNSFALMVFRRGLDKSFGREVGRWFVLLQAAQFHVIFYASRTLPNMFAFGFTTLAFRAFLQDIDVGKGDAIQKRGKFRAKLEARQKVGIFLFVFAGVVFRSEIAILLFAQLLNLFFRNRIWSIRKLILDGIQAAVFALAVSVPVDSYFWWKPIWPELAGFYYNAIQGKSADWGISPFSHYFSTLLPRLLLNPLMLIVLIPMALMTPATRYSARDLTFPSILFIAIYSLQPHKESRFIIYVVPPLTAAAALSASYIWTRRTKSLLYRLGSLALIASLLLSFAASTAMLLISSLNYPGGQALSQFHSIVRNNPPRDNKTVVVHMDVLSCMTGVTRFLSPTSIQLPGINNKTIHLHYDKTENEDELLTPSFWEQFDYAMMEEPEKAIGKWEIVDTVFAYGGIEFLRPGDEVGDGETESERVYEANNETKSVEGEEMQRGSEDVVDALEERGGEVDRDRRGMIEIVRGVVRRVTGGWWAGPRMVPKIRILRRMRDW